MALDMDGAVRSMMDLTDQLPHHLRGMAEQAFAREEAEKQAAFADKAAFEARRQRMRRHFCEMIGGLDLPKTPLNTRLTGVLVRPAYEVRKLVFESRPGFHVTANLYVPRDANGIPRDAEKLPAVLFVCGHGEHAKAHDTYQKTCIDLASNGLVVLAMDCVGQGERFQYIDRQTGRMLVRWGVHEHSYAGQQFYLTGGNIAQVFVWDMIRALDVLCELDFVDATRLGVTGASGGGTQSSYLMMADERLAAAAPCNYLTSREIYMKTGQPHDAEQNLFASIEHGLNNDDYVLAFAPKPLLIGSVSSDFFCIEGVERTYARGRQAYALYGAEEKLTLKTVPGLHNLNDDLRQEVVNFFRQVFLGLPGDFVTDANMHCDAPQMMWCLPHGQVLRDLPDEITVSDIAAARVPATRRDLTPQNLAQTIAGFLRMPPKEQRITIRPRFLNPHSSEMGKATPLFFFSQPDITVCGTLYQAATPSPDRCARTLAIYTSAEGTNDVLPHEFAIKEMVTRCDVLDFDARGLGTARCRDVNPSPYRSAYGTLFKLNYDAVMLGTSLLAMHVFDLVRASELARQMGYERVIFAGHGYGGVLALLAAAVTGDVAEAENLPDCFARKASERIFAYDPLYDVHGVLNCFDLPELIAALGERATVRQVPDAGAYIL